jgi:hypothetical protein
MNWLEIVIAWAEDYGQYPYWKIYKDKVGGNPYATSVTEGADFVSSMARLRKSLESLPRGHFVLQLKKTFDSQVGNVTTEFDKTSEAVYSQINGISAGTGGNLDPSKFVSVETAHQMINDKMDRFIADQKRAEMERELAAVKKELEKEKKRADKAEYKSGHKMDAMIGLVKEVKEIFPMIQQYGKPQIALAGFQDQEKKDTNASAQNTAETNTEKTVVDPAEDWDEQDERISDAITMFIEMKGGDKSKVADLLEGLIGYIKVNPDMYKMIEPQILETRKFYKNE